MAVVKWRKQTWLLFNSYVEHARLEYGEKTARKWLTEVAVIYDRLQKYPLSYTPEQLLISKRHQYRSCHIMRRFKMVYYYTHTSDTVYIRDLWDTRMNPQTLVRRLK
jgi:hypothetical protein